MYADDVSLFIWPVVEEMGLTMEILHNFGEASGLHCNLQKSCVVPIRCEPLQLEMVSSTLPCTPASFPCTYLGLPVSIKQFRKAELLLWIERIGDKLPAWKASLMNMAGRVTWVHFVLYVIPIYVLIAIKVPKWFIRSIDEIRKSFHLEGTETSKWRLLPSRLG